MSAKHTPGPWGIERTEDTNWIGPLRPDGKVASIVADTDREGLRPEALARNDADAERIVACVSACEGLADPSVVPELLAALKLFMTCYPAAIAALNDEQQQLIRGALAKAGR